MHKSGTTLIARILHESGINMGNFDTSITYDQGNQFERKEFQKINKHILDCGDLHSAEVITPLPKDYRNEVVGGKIRSEIQELDSLYEDWGFKDPRTCLTYDFWYEYLPEHKTIFVFRSPIEVWHHYQKNIPKYRYVKRYLASVKAIKAWTMYNGCLLEYIDKTDETAVVIEYSEFMKQTGSVEELSDILGLELTDMRDMTLYRAKMIPDIGYKLFSIFVKLSKKWDVEVLHNKLKAKK